MVVDLDVIKERAAQAAKTKASIKASTKTDAKVAKKHSANDSISMGVLLAVGIAIVIIYHFLKSLISPVVRASRVSLVSNIGEYWVKEALEQLDPDEYKTLHDIFLPTTGDISQTQIDHVVISNYGVFCIETKSFNGKIYGNGNKSYWSQFLYGNEYLFMNPCRQNYKHTQAIKECIRKKCVFSIIVFTHVIEVKVANTSEVVVGVEDLIRKIMSFHKKILTDNEREEIYQLLLANNIDSPDIRQRHHTEVQMKKSQIPTHHF